MDWLDNQIKYREECDDETLERAFLELASVVSKKKGSRRTRSGDKGFETALGDIFDYLGVKPDEPPSLVDDPYERLEYMLRPTGVMHRRVELTPGWSRGAAHPLLAVTADGDSVALLPHPVNGLYYTDAHTGRRVRITKANESGFLPDAICFYRSLPSRSVGVGELLRFMAKTCSAADYIMIAAATLAAALLGMLTPFAVQLAYSDIIPLGNELNLVPLLAMLLGGALAALLVKVYKLLLRSRICGKISHDVRSAVMARLFTLPAEFFKRFTSGDLAMRADSLTSFAEYVSSAFFGVLLEFLFSLAYLIEIQFIAPALAGPAAAILLLQIAGIVGSCLLERYYVSRELTKNAKLSGFVYLLISGIQKIKLAGAQKRAFGKWAELYSDKAKYEFKPFFGAVCSATATLVGAAVFYLAAAANSVPLADYIAFSSAFGILNGAALSLSSLTDSIAALRPQYKMAEPILAEQPETSEAKRSVTGISGGVELNNVSFRYGESDPLVLKNINLKINAGQYVAIVGRTGCGKSTLMRLMLGFEKPTTGAVYFDKRDLQTLDARSVRKHIGVVMQNSRVFTGDIYSNITVAAPQLSVDEAWEVAETAQLADDIRKMPMGMRTLIREGEGGISGGQRQRLMIARAIAPKPGILMFDEATSALDNVSQANITSALGALKCTRIVIAHRLSTIQSCDRIVVLDGGGIAEDGTFSELMAKRGLFYELARRQTPES